MPNINRTVKKKTLYWKDGQPHFFCYHCNAGFQSQHHCKSRNSQHKNTCILYHMTDATAARSIVSTQTFRPGTSGLAGGGIYFAETPEDTKHKARSQGPILQAKVNLGKQKNLSYHGDPSLTHEQLKQEGYDSVKIPRNGTEHVVYSSDQVTEIQYYSHGK
jgi:hypothetical protein